MVSKGSSSALSTLQPEQFPEVYIMFARPFLFPPTPFCWREKAVRGRKERSAMSEAKLCACVFWGVSMTSTGSGGRCEQVDLFE